MFPVESVLGEIKRHLAENRDVVLTAPPGSGKTTCVPPSLLGEPWLAGKKILMLEPRRLAARNCAGFIASKLGEKTGGTVGYQVRLERKVSSATRLEIITEGLLTQRLLSDPELSDVGLIIFDEFHERSLSCDMGFALSLEVRRALRDDLRLLVMSATLDASEVAAHIGDAAIVRAEGRMFPVETRYVPGLSIAAAVAQALRETDGDVLCFLPGEGEIRRASETISNVDAQVYALYGAMPKEAQDAIFRPTGHRKVILSTSIAETSVTLDGVSAVVDTGLMRVSRFSPSTGMSALLTLPLTMDRAEQRRGRAGRVREGVCYRLWSESDERSRAAKAQPEILEADLSSLVLASAAWGALRREDLPWLTLPKTSSWEQATGLLRMLGALDEDGSLTDKGRKMSTMPMHPRLANMLLGGGDPLLAAIIEEGAGRGESDIRFVPRTPRIKALGDRFSAFARPGAAPMSEGAMLALAYPDRIAKNRGNGTFRMVNGRGAFLDGDDPMAREKYIVCCKLDERSGDAKVFLGCGVSESEILSLYGERIEEREHCFWDRRSDSVVSTVRGELGAMTVYEKPKPDAQGVQKAVLDGIRIKGVENMPSWTQSSLQMRRRMDFLRHRAPEGEVWPDVSDAALIEAMEGFVQGVGKWRDLEKVDMTAVLDGILCSCGRSRRELDLQAPVRMEVPSGSNMTIHYEGDEPTVQVRLQECFGLMETPKIAYGRVPVVMTLLSPAQRPIQVTKDLSGFWKGAYQLVRKDMRGRYPKHYWPEDPFTAVATRRVRPDNRDGAQAAR